MMAHGWTAKVAVIAALSRWCGPGPKRTNGVDQDDLDRKIGSPDNAADAFSLARWRSLRRIAITTAARTSVCPHISAYALHVQCPWRLDGPIGTVNGRDDLWVYAGPDERPPNWSYENGWRLQDKRFASLFIRDERTRSWVNESHRFVVIATRQTTRGDVSLELANEHALLVFPAGSQYEAWRFFSPGSARHLIFPTTARD
jgi:hypothetical protein